MEMSMKRFFGQKASRSAVQGFTLVELMVAMAISSIVAAAIYLAFSTQQKSWNTQEQVTQMQQNLRAGLRVLSDELMLAGYDPEGYAGAGFVTATATAVRFTMNLDSDSGDTDVSDDGEDITYQLNGNAQLCRVNGDPGSNTCEPIADGIEQIEFFYTLEDGTATTAPSSAQLIQIRSVQVSLLARSEVIMPGYAPPQAFTPASGAGSWGGNDNRRRMFLTMTVQCRNKGF